MSLGPILTGLFSCILLLLSPGAAEHASAIRLTPVTHLFDITHNFSQPSDVAVAKDGLIYIVDGVNNKIKVFDRNGKFAFSFGSKGTLKGQFKFPMGIDVGDSGNVYVADSGNSRVQIFSPTGHYISRINIPSKTKPADPTDVAVNETLNRLYIADNENHYFLVYDMSDMELFQTIGSPGEEDREFRYPFLMALDRNNYLYITDVVNTRVQVFNAEGLFVNIIGGWGVTKGKFFRPKGIATDGNQRIFVSDSYMGVIQVFNSDGEFYSAIGDAAGENVRKFIKPMGIYIDHLNRLYVVEMFAERVSVYQIEGDTE